MSTAFITGINGQDGSYLVEFLLAKGYDVIGTTRNRRITQERAVPFSEKIEIVETDLLDQGLLEDLLRKYKPDEVYNLAARASSSELWVRPVLTGELNALGVARMLDAISKVDRDVRFVQASSSEVFGNATEVPQTELTPFRPRNPYGVAKAYGHWMTATYREHQNLFACSCILYNHESPRRGLEFVSRKISHAVAKISLGQVTKLHLGRLEARRDWGFAGDYVQAMWLMLQQPGPGDYIVATGETHSVRGFCEVAFAHVGLDYRDFVVEDVSDHRASETGVLMGDPSKAHRVLGWKPMTTFQELVRMMVDADIKAIRDSQISEKKASLSALA